MIAKQVLRLSEGDVSTVRKLRKCCINRAFLTEGFLQAFNILTCLLDLEEVTPHFPNVFDLVQAPTRAVHFENSCSGESSSPVGYRPAVRNTAQHPPSAVVCPQGQSAAGPVHSHATPSGSFCLQIGNRPLRCDFATYSPYCRP